MCCVVYQMEIFVLHMCVVCLFCFVQIKAEIGFETQNYDKLTCVSCSRRRFFQSASIDMSEANCESSANARGPKVPQHLQ